MDSTYYRHAEDTTSRLVMGEAVILRVPDGEMTILNESGTILWALANGARTGEEMAESLARHYQLATTPDIGEFLNELVAMALLVPHSRPISRRPTMPLPEPHTYFPPATRVQEMMETLSTS